MPLYTYQCSDCQQTTDAFRTVANRNDCPKCECGGETKKVISSYRVIGDMEPYFDDNLETHIKSRQHRKQVMKEKGVDEKVGKGWWTSARR